ncbi:mucin-3B-like [Armigeres subalbatus]|uniref:mucin-3B-like n=1 Tax=Armigeres subalbatus TaxID=124917 RepID=UPI002ED22338
MTSQKNCTTTASIVTSASTAAHASSSSISTSNAIGTSSHIPSALTVSSRILRSPSHESFSTDLSLISISVSSMASEATSVLNRSSCSLLTKTMEDKLGNLMLKDSKKNRSSTLTEKWSESNDLIRNCATLSAALGIHKSFSTTDIYQLPSDQHNLGGRLSTSELALTPFQKAGYLFDHPRLDHTSRSYSTWVAVGELASTSQLPSPHGGQSSNQVPTICNATPTPSFTVSDLISSVNKKIRQNYIRRRLYNTYRAIERLSQSEFNLDRLEAAAFAANNFSNPGPTELVVPTTHASASPVGGKSVNLDSSPVATGSASPSATPMISAAAPQSKKSSSSGKSNAKKNLTFLDIESERGKPLSKYERHMLIFNWLHTIDDSPMEIEN